MILVRPPSSRAILLNDGITALNNWMMMVALMYGMMPSEPMEQCSMPPPVNMLNRPSTPPRSFLSMYSASAAPFSQGMGMSDARRQIASTPTVNKIRDFNSGILKQLANVVTMLRNMVWVTD